MRYIKVLILAIFFFLAMIFFFQNQAPLSQQTELGLNLFFLPPMKAIALPFYFIVIAAFLVGCLFTLFFLVWDKFTTSAKLMKTKWQVNTLKSDNAKLTQELAASSEALSLAKGLPLHTPAKTESTDAPAKEHPAA